MADKHDVAAALGEIARYLEIGGENRFKTAAFERASRSIEAFDGNLDTLVRTARLETINGIGKAIGPLITELVTTGSLGYLEELRKQYPPGIFRLLEVPGLGAKKIGILHEKLGISSVEDLERACLEGRLLKLAGFGSKTQQRILDGIAFARAHSGRLLLNEALPLADSLLTRLRSIDAIDRAEISGSVRRRMEVVGNLNAVVCGSSPAAIESALREREIVSDLRALDAHTLSGTVRGSFAVLIHLCSPESFGVTLLTTTGSEEFVVGVGREAAARGFELRATGLFHEGDPVRLTEEKEIFERLGVRPVPPELRESGEELARKKRVTLIEREDLRGTFHAHTTWSDGKASVSEMLHAASERGFEFVGLTDHSQAAAYAGGLTPSQVILQQAEIDSLAGGFAPMRVFKGTEADILQDGEIDYDTETLARFDFVIASVHSRFRMEKEPMTERLVRATMNPFVTFLGHLTGRLLLSREGYSIDFDRVFASAAKQGVMIEINADPRRMEIDWRLIGQAKEHGVGFSIHPDAHSTRAFDYLRNGVWIARKAGLRARDIFNTRPAAEIAQYLATRKKRALATLG